MPRHQRTEVHPGPPRALLDGHRADGEGRTVLHVEDDDGYAALISALLAPEQIQVVRAGRLAHACRLASDDALLAALVDLDLPDARGLHSVVELRRASPDLPIVVLSGQDSSVAVKAVTMGAQEWVSKDQVDAARLLRALELAVARQDAEAAAIWAAMHDPVTGLPGRGLASEHLTRALARARRRGGPVAALFIDVDRFKAINDAHGHAVGDEVLATVARRLVSALRPYDVVGRWGGDEFLVVAEHTDAQEACKLAGRLREEAARPVSHNGRHVEVTLSVGIAVDGQLAPSELIEQADLAMLDAKRAGSGIRSFGPGVAGRS